jgi:hypothetical protein
MALRLLLAVIGLLELVFPQRVVDFWMGLATDEPVELRRWVYTAARIEGLVLLLWVVTRARSPSEAEESA